jgi:hypothetical protein
MILHMPAEARVSAARDTGGRAVLLTGIALLAAASLPLFSTVLPPLLDYPNHLARFWLLAVGGSRFYAVRWAPLPNLAGDLVVPLLARVVPLELAGKLFLVALFVLTLGGAAWLNRMVCGGWRRWPLVASAFLYNRELLWGFANYLFGLGLALCGAALWLALERRPAWLRLLVSLPVALLCYLSHIAAFGVYAILIAGIETGPALRELRRRDWPGVVRRAALAGAQFVAPALLLIAWWRPAASGGGFAYGHFWRKADLLFSVFDNYSRPFDVVCFALLLALLGGLLWRRRLHLAPRLIPALVLLGAAYLALPSQMLSGSGVDRRMPVALFLVLIAAAAPRWPTRRAAISVAAAAAVVLAARLAVVEAVWLKADRVYAADLTAIDALPAGARLAVAYPAAAVNAGGIPELHVAALAVWRRDAFVPTLFADPAQQPIAMRPPYAALAAETRPDRLWAAFIAGNAVARNQVAPVLAGYGFVAFVAPAPFRVGAPPGCLRPLAQRATLQIFAIDRAAACGAP